MQRFSLTDCPLLVARKQTATQEEDDVFLEIPDNWDHGHGGQQTQPNRPIPTHTIHSRHVVDYVQF